MLTPCGYCFSCPQDSFYHQTSQSLCYSVNLILVVNGNQKKTDGKAFLLGVEKDKGVDTFERWNRQVEHEHPINSAPHGG